MKDRYFFISIAALVIAFSSLSVALTKKVMTEKFRNQPPTLDDSFPVTNASDGNITIYFDGDEYGPYVIPAGTTRVFTLESKCPETEAME